MLPSGLGTVRVQYPPRSVNSRAGEDRRAWLWHQILRSGSLRVTSRIRARSRRAPSSLNRRSSAHRRFHTASRCPCAEVPGSPPGWGQELSRGKSLLLDYRARPWKARVQCMEEGAMQDWTSAGVQSPWRVAGIGGDATLDQRHGQHPRHSRGGNVRHPRDLRAPRERGQAWRQEECRPATEAPFAGQPELSGGKRAGFLCE